MATFYATCLLFIFVVLGSIARARLLDLEVHQVHQGRTSDRAGYVFVRIGAASHDGKDGEPGRRQGIDRFMSEARALTNLIGNGVATIVVAKWTGDLNVERLQAGLNNETWIEAQEPEALINAREAKMTS